MRKSVYSNSMFSRKFVDQYFNVIIYNFIGSFALNRVYSCTSFILNK